MKYAILSANRTAMLTRSIANTQEEYTDAPRRMSINLLRRDRTGIGWRNKAVAKQKLTVASDWQITGHAAKFIQLFTWNAGNLQRAANNDTSNDLMCQRWHICCIHEANSERVQQPLYDARAIQSSSTVDRTIMANSGGSGYQLIEKTHDAD